MKTRYSHLLPLALAGGLSTAAALSLTACTAKITDNSVQRISVTEAADRIRKSGGDVLILDTRTPSDFAAGHIPGARRVDLPEIDETDPDPSLKGRKMIIVYGQNPGSGAAMALSKRLLAAEIGTVRLMEDGYARWEAAGQPVEKAPQ